MYTPDGWYTLARSACRKPYQVIKMEFQQWLAWKQLAKAYMKIVKIAEDGNSVNWLTLKWTRITNTDPDAFYVKDHQFCGRSVV